MSYIKYGNFEFKAQNGYPVPQISISNTQDRDSSGRLTSYATNINLDGVIYATGNEGFAYLTSRESALRQVFRIDGQLFVIGCTGAGGSQIPYFSGTPRILKYSADKTENYWLNTIAYNIEMQIDVCCTGSLCYNSGIFCVSNTQDEVSIETIDDFSYVGGPHVGLRKDIPLEPMFSGYPIYRVTRTLSAAGKYTPSGKSAIANAKEWVIDAGSKNSFTGYLVGLNLYNFTRSISINEPEGSYRITDNWLATSSAWKGGSWTESFNIESSLDNSLLRTVTIGGTIKGLEDYNTNLPLYSSGTLGTGISGTLYPTYEGSRKGLSRFANATSGYQSIKSRNVLFERADAALEKIGDPSGINKRFFSRNEPPLNPIPYSVTEGYNPTEGTVTYSWTYNNRPLNMISGSISETLTVNDTLPTKQIAELFVLGRRLGPVLQDLGTYTIASRDVTFEVVMPRPSSLSGLKAIPTNSYAAITGLVDSFNPEYIVREAVKSFVRNDTESWSVSEGRFVKSKSWSWSRCAQ